MEFTPEGAGTYAKTYGEQAHHKWDLRSIGARFAPVRLALLF